MLAEKIPSSTLYDQKVIGFGLRRALRLIKEVDDYQDYALWRGLVVGAARVMRATSARTLVIPMTVWRRDYFDAILGGLRRVDPDVTCLRPTASREGLLHRTSSDLEDAGAYGWRASHVEARLEALRDPAFGVEVPTDGLTPPEVADRVLDLVGTPTG